MRLFEKRVPIIDNDTIKNLENMQDYIDKVMFEVKK